MILSADQHLARAQQCRREANALPLDDPRRARINSLAFSHLAIADLKLKKCPNAATRLIFDALLAAWLRSSSAS
jgi:hypothetical protein